MSVERELLKKVISGDNKGDFFIPQDLYKDIKASLAQPEQEPVAWMYDHHIEVGHDKYTEFNVVETCARNLEFESCINVRPLYLTPPKREQKPLTRQQISEGNQSMLNVTRDAFVNGVKWAEKAHGITGENDE
jgi:hypothetical protein